MVKVLANACLAFDRGEKDGSGNLIRVATTIGFCELPDWAAETDYFKSAVEAKIINVVTQKSEEATLADVERIKQLEAEVAALKAEKAVKKPAAKDTEKK